MWERECKFCQVREEPQEFGKEKKIKRETKRLRLYSLVKSLLMQIISSKIVIFLSKIFKSR